MNKLFLDSLGWEIESHPIQFLNSKGEICLSDDFRVISRNDTNEALSVMSGKYNPTTVASFEDATAKMVEASGMALQGFQEFNEGKIVLSILKNENPLEVNGFPIDDYLVLGTSFDGSYPFFIGTSTILVRCQNQFSKIHMLSKVRHTVNSTIRREFALEGMKVYFDEREQMYKNFEFMSKVPMDKAKQEAFTAFILNIDEANGEELPTKTLNRKTALLSAITEETEALGNNLFGVFNGLTKYTTHVYQPRKESPFGNIIGSANDLNQKGYAYCLNFAQSA